MALVITEAQLRQIEQSLLGRVNLRPRSITEDKLAVGAASAAIVREGSISDVHIGTLRVDALTGGTISGEVIVLDAGGTIRSADYDPGLAGWQIHADGSAEFNNVEIRGSFVAGTIDINSGAFSVAANGDVVAANIVATGVITALAGSNLPGDYITNGATGANLDLTGNITIGGAIILDGTPGAIRTAPLGRRVEMVGGASAPSISFYSGQLGELVPASVGTLTETTETLRLLSPSFGAYPDTVSRSQIDLACQTFNQGGVVNEARATISSAEVHVSAGDAEFRFLQPGVLRMYYDGTALQAGNVQFYDGDDPPVRLGYVGFASNDDLRLWNEAAAGAVLFGTDATSRGSIATDGSWTFGSSSAPQGISHAFYNEGDGSPCVVVLNRQGSFTGSPRGIDVYLGASGAVNNPQNDDDFIRFRRGDGAVVGQIDGDGSGGTRYATTSDQALKADVSKDLAEGAAAFDRIPWRSFTWKGSGVRGHGVIAQQLARIPEWSHVVKRGGTFTEHDPDTGRKRRYRSHWGVDYVPLIGAIGAKLADVDRRLRALEDR